MKSLYESILSSTNSGKKALFKSFDIDDIFSSNRNLDWEKFIIIKEMKKIIKNKLNISTNGLNNSRLFAVYLTTIDFTLKEWDIIQNPSPSKLSEIDKIFKEKFQDVLIPELVNDYTIGITKEKIYVSPKRGIRISNDLGIMIGDPFLVQFRLKELSF
jgi:hypothetical protein